MSGGNPHATALRVDLEVRFEALATVGRRAYIVPPGDRWAVNLDDVHGAPQGQVVNATVRVTCDQACAAAVALWHRPIGQGEPTVYSVPFVCVGEDVTP